jgi:LuxR family transcriptional regulator, transcriptional regulator of spore coat protein
VRNELAPHPLTPEEIRMLNFVAAGHSARDVAKLIGSTSHSVYKALDRLKIKMRARNRPHMIVLAYGAALIQPQERRPHASAG